MKAILVFSLSIIGLIIGALMLSGCAFMEDKPGAIKWRTVCVTKEHHIPVTVPQELAYVHDGGGLVCEAVFP